MRVILFRVSCEQLLGYNESCRVPTSLLKGYSLSHDQVALDIWQRCRSKVLKLDKSKTLAPSVNFEVEYPSLADHEEIA